MTSLTVGASAASAVVLVGVAVGASSPTMRTSSSVSAWACADRSAATALSACATAGRAAAAASVASWLSARARSSCAVISPTSGGGVDDPHALAVALSTASAAADKSTLRLLRVGWGLGTCNILPLQNGRLHIDGPARLPLAAAALAYR